MLLEERASSSCKDNLAPILFPGVCHWHSFCCSQHEMETGTDVAGPKFMYIFIAVTTKKYVANVIGFSRCFKNGGVLAKRCVWPVFLLIRVNEAMVLIPSQRCRKFFFLLSVEICSYLSTICERSTLLVTGCIFFFFYHLVCCCCGPAKLCKGLIWCTLKYPPFQTAFLKLERVR